MITYLVLNLIFFISVILFLPKKMTKPQRAFWITLAGLIVLTAIFDPIIIALNIVDYDPTKILGLYLFGAPIEDFFYAVYAACIVPLIWHTLEKYYGKSS